MLPSQVVAPCCDKAATPPSPAQGQVTTPGSLAPPPSPPPTAEARALPRRLRHQSIMMIVNSIDCLYKYHGRVSPAGAGTHRDRIP